MRQSRQNYGPHEIARVTAVRVRQVFARPEPAVLEIREDVGARGFEQGAKNAAAARTHRGEAEHARSPNEPQEDGFGLVVGGVAERDRVAGEIAGRLREERVARAAQRILGPAGESMAAISESSPRVCAVRATNRASAAPRVPLTPWSRCATASVNRTVLPIR
jgi:hypothetical protein